MPLIESEVERAVVGLRIDAPQGVLALLESDGKDTVLFCNCRQKTAPMFCSAPSTSQGHGLPHCLSTTLICGCTTPNSRRRLGGNWSTSLTRVPAYSSVPEQAIPGFDAMNVVPMNEPAQSARGESACDFCGRPWFGLVAYCPYCGRKSSLTTIHQEPDGRPPGDEASASDPGTLQTPAGAPRQEAKSPRKEPDGTPLQGVPVSGRDLPVERDRPTPSRLNEKASTLRFKTVAAGASALLILWMAVKLLAPGTNEGASRQLPISTSGIASPRPVPATSAAQGPSIPRRTDNAVPPQSNRSLCSVANETAGLCKVQ